MKQEKSCQGVEQLINEMDEYDSTCHYLKCAQFNKIRQGHARCEKSKTTKEQKRFVLISFIYLKNGQQENNTIDTEEKTIIKKGVATCRVYMFGCFSRMQTK